MATYQAPPLPRAFISRRLHSLMGLFLVLFLIEHLLTNSEAALPLGDDGAGFVRMVNFIHSLPYLEAIEIALIGLPMLFHIFWGVGYLLTSEPNSYSGNGSRVALPEYARNHAYTWQRITSWLLLVGVLAHVAHMRIGNYPLEIHMGSDKVFINKVSVDDGIYTVAHRLGVALLDDKGLAIVGSEILSKVDSQAGAATAGAVYDYDQASSSIQRMKTQRIEKAKAALKEVKLGKDELAAVSPSHGIAWLMVVRDTFKSPVMAALYSLFVVAAAYHACNGVWTFLVTWGITVSERSQALARKAVMGLTVLLSFFGLSCAWAVYWLNLPY